AVPASPIESPQPVEKRSEVAADGAGPAVLPLRGAAARIAANMEASLGVPTATSVRVVPAGLLEVNRRILNNQLARVGAGKVSVTHLIGFAVIKALQAVPNMNSSFVPGNPPGVIHHQHVGLGLAVDQKKSDGTRTLLVPVVKGADTLEFRAYWAAYEELIRKIRTGRIGPDDFAGATLTLTNPGTVGTVGSVPRLMPGQGVIVAVGSLDYPAEWQAADPRTLAALGLSKVMTLTSTYDHRIIQGAESGLFLARVHQLLIGEHAFYDEIFHSMGIPYEPVRWLRDNNDPSGNDSSHTSQIQKQVHVQTLINMYRVRGHLIAHLDPLDWREPHTHPELNTTTYGLTLWDLEREFLTDGLAGHATMKLGDILGVLRDAYCRTVGVEYMHIQEPDQKKWIQEHVEGISIQLRPEEHRHILSRLNAAEALERFLDTKYIGQKRFGLEGAESAIPLLDSVLDQAAQAGMESAVLGMAHRGRLNVLINIVGKSYGELFQEFEGNLDPDTTQGTGDVKYHKGYHGKFTGLSGVDLNVHLSSNPSHLEAVDPVVEGMTRAYQDLSETGNRRPVLAVLVHGDAAFAGQGVVAETLNMSALRGYTTGGTVHLVINNQLGFTTNPESARSSVYATDVAKMVQAPIFHVNGDDPEACVRVGRLAFQFRQAFHKDVVIDMVCYRRFGHNEQDDPSLTQPGMYDLIKIHRSVRKIYTETLVRRGDITMEEAEAALKDFRLRLQAALDETRAAAPPRPTKLPDRLPSAPVLPPISTAVPIETLDRIASVLHNPPEGFTVHPKLVRVFDNRAKLWAGGEADWALGEAMAYGSLLLEGHDVRLAGQDTRRGTFGHRNAALIDVETGTEWIPLQHLDSVNWTETETETETETDSRPSPGRFFVYDSLLSEYAALGFEYGYSVVQQDALVAWEAQFGDFVNGGQIIIDQFLVASKAKWGQTCGLTLLLPHGYEGQGAEHSSARVERFLQLCAEDNIQVVNPTTAAQLFHLLRRQVHRRAKRPLILLSPKKYLRAREAYSKAEEFSTGHFREVIDDDVADPDSVRRVILASGKTALDLMTYRTRPRSTGTDPLTSGVAIVRVEQLYPWPDDQIAAAVARYPGDVEVVWAQEEPENMGPWWFVRAKLQKLLGGDARLSSVARLPSGSPATGSAALSALEAEDLMVRGFGGG
ncbi:MAG: multifunctional oxoglutarate decarboxylase/oxoglutarate dehydrogenase thiamine pyrophosphate-binding subunit/dihydrolipoyllysine-residue succinyltransferase subunit, partial [Actinomycetota bacterium]|nr:multifunctional oxoglutarate decarboxylase/oxoglutarate dehydrogenase thiamine pyrophosphate-binding subunit/dihydrolipoyllysine-residue succinyltransferase subunit [Actinomycetota bacterium]